MAGDDDVSRRIGMCTASIICDMSSRVIGGKSAASFIATKMAQMIGWLLSGLLLSFYLVATVVETISIVILLLVLLAIASTQRPTESTDHR